MPLLILFIAALFITGVSLSESSSPESARRSKFPISGVSLSESSSPESARSKSSKPDCARQSITKLREGDRAAVRKELAGLSNIDDGLYDTLLEAVALGEVKAVDTLLIDSLTKISSHEASGRGWVIKHLDEAFEVSMVHKRFECFQILLAHYQAWAVGRILFPKQTQYLNDLLFQALEKEFHRAVYLLALKIDEVTPKALWKAAELDSTGIFLVHDPLSFDDEVAEDAVLVAISNDSARVLDYFLPNMAKARLHETMLACIKERSANCFAACISELIGKIRKFELGGILECLELAIKIGEINIVIQIMEYLNYRKLLSTHADTFRPCISRMFTKIVRTFNSNALGIFAKHFSPLISEETILEELVRHKDNPQLDILLENLCQMNFDYVNFFGKHVTQRLNFRYGDRDRMEHIRNLHKCISNHRIPELYHLIFDITWSSGELAHLCRNIRTLRHLTNLMYALNRFDLPRIAEIISSITGKSKKEFGRWALKILGQLTYSWVMFAKEQASHGYISVKSLPSLLLDQKLK